MQRLLCRKLCQWCLRMKKILLWIIVLIVLCSGVFAVNITDGIWSCFNLEDGAGTTVTDAISGINASLGVGEGVWNLSSSAVGSSSITLNTNSDGIDINDIYETKILNTEDFSFGGWIRPRDISTTNQYFWTFREVQAVYTGVNIGSTTDALAVVEASGGAIILSYDVSEHFDLNKWYLLTFTYNSTDQLFSVYVNNSLVDSDTVSGTFTTGADTNHFIGSRAGQDATGFIGGIDDLFFSNRTYAVEDIIDLYNYNVAGVSCPYTSSDSSTIDIIAINETGSIKGNFSTGEEIVYYINWTDSDGNSLNDSVGICDMVLFDGYFEESAGDDNFTLCNSGCEIDTVYKDNFSFDNYSYVDNLIHFQGCNEGIPVGDVYVGISCSSESETIPLGSIFFSDCDDGLNDIFLYSNVCINDTLVFVNISLDAPYNKRKRIEYLNFDKKYDFFNATYPDSIIYNESLGLWQNGMHEYYDSGLINVSASCIHNVTPDLDNSVIEEFQITGDLPFADFLGIVNVFGFVDFVAGIPFEYSSGIWEYFGIVIDDNPHTLNLTWYNVSNNVIATDFLDYTNFSTLHDPFTPDGLFADFGYNPINFSVTLTDLDDNFHFSSFLFNVTDVDNPILSGVSNDTITNNTNYSFSHTVSDEYIWLYNVSCSDGYIFQESAIGNNSYLHTFNRNVSGTLSCDILICDGHTGYVTDPIEYELIDDKSIMLGVHNITSSVSIKKMETINLFDRTKFIIETNKPQSNFYFTLSDDWVHAPNSKYKGHFINMKTKEWIDFEGDDTIIVNGNYVYVYNAIPKSRFEFESIGILNCAYSVQTINGTVEIVPTPPVQSNIIPEDDLPTLVLYLVLVILILFWGEKIGSRIILITGSISIWWVASLFHQYSVFIFGLLLVIGVIEFLRALTLKDKNEGL